MPDSLTLKDYNRRLAQKKTSQVPKRKVLAMSEVLAMFEIDSAFIVFAIILAVSLVIPEILKEAQMVVVPVYIIAGALLGPQGLGTETHAALEFIGEIGLLFLVFIAGLEIHEHGDQKWKKPLRLAVVSAGTCFIFGFLLGHLWGYPLHVSFLLGSILMSSSVGEVIPLVTSSAHLRHKFSDYLLPAVILMDACSLFLLTVLLQWDLSMDFAIFLFGAAIIILTILFAVPRLSQWFFSRKTLKPRETDLRFIITILIASVLVGEAFHIHGIFIAFLVGALLGRYIPNEKTQHKLHGFGHGFFIPIFFVVLGMKMDISLFATPRGLLLVSAITVGLMGSKITGALIFAQLEKMKTREGLLLGTTLWPQLNATLAATAVAFKVGIFDDELLTGIVFMSLATAFITPFSVRRLVAPHEKSHDMKNHTLIIGYGRTSARLAYLLDMDGKDFMVIDRKLSRVNLLKNQGIEAILGDGDDYTVLKKANIKDIRVAVITIPDDHEVYRCAKHIKEKNPSCHILARVHDWDAYEQLKSENLIDFAVWPEKLSSEIIIKHIIDSDLWGPQKPHSGSTQELTSGTPGVPENELTAGGPKVSDGEIEPKVQ